ncbi:unnamed protein product [Trifolium pratense]|uniref:Uncharacterized protein n=1 Tax=Trifolium pratense TaxID=57577 RepID=A0ACB0KWW2_TRIPR|nr:unnamed protein product [Trifolium pratense]
MRLMVIALVIVLLASSCNANDKRNLVSTISENQQGMKGDHKVINQNIHHRIPIPQKSFDKPDGSSQFGVTDDNDHHYIPRKDYGTHPGHE